MEGERVNHMVAGQLQASDAYGLMKIQADGNEVLESGALYIEKTHAEFRQEYLKGFGIKTYLIEVELGQTWKLQYN